MRRIFCTSYKIECFNESLKIIIAIQKSTKFKVSIKFTFSGGFMSALLIFNILFTHVIVVNTLIVKKCRFFSIPKYY